MITSISYNGKKVDGAEDWSGIHNIKLLDFELLTGMQVVLTSNACVQFFWYSFFVLVCTYRLDDNAACGMKVVRGYILYCTSSESKLV